MGIDWLNLPSDIRHIGDYAFKDNLLSVLNIGVYQELLQIGVEAFADNQIETLNFNGLSLTVIEDYAFYANSITDVDFNSAANLMVIGQYAFASNDILSITMNDADRLEYIGAYAFAINPILNITLPTPDVPGYNFVNWTGSNASTYVGGASINNFNISYLADLNVTGYPLTFNVTDGTNPIEGAYVYLETYGTRVTNAAGVATFESVDDGISDYSVTAFNYDETIGDVTVSGSSLSEDVTLDASKFEVSFYVTDGANPVGGITLNFDGTDYILSGAGYQLIDNLLPGVYNYSISDENYLEYSSSVEIVGVDTEEFVELTRIYSVNFTVIDETENVEGATINFDGVDYFTNASGLAIISNLSQGTFDYTVTADDHLSETGQITLVDSNIEYAVELQSVYSITFNITNGMNPIVGAIVSLDGNEYTSNATGIVIVEDLLPGAYSYSVSADNFETINSTFTLTTNQVINIELDDAYQVEFYVSNGAIPVENAELIFDTETYLSNSAGFITLEAVTAGTYNFQINANGYFAYNAEIVVSDEDVVVEITLSSTSVDTFNAASIEVYPNPTVGQLNFNGVKSSVRVEIYNMSGQMVNEICRDFDFSIDISDYPAGTYMIRLIPKGSNMVIKRIIKE